MKSLAGVIGTSDCLGGTVRRVECLSPCMRSSVVTVALATTTVVSLAAAATAIAGSRSEPDAQAAHTQLVGRSILPAQTYRVGSAPSGFFQTGTTAVPRPYPAQPVQGFSGTHRNADGSYLVMTDNGFGNKANSPDFELVVNRIKPDTATGVTAYLGLEFVLTDPDHLVPWAIWRDGACTAAGSLPTGYSCPAPDRVLTGWDFDIESMQLARDGTFWFGDEFGPFLLHTDSDGRLIDAPIPAPGVKSPQNPTLAAGETPNLASSRGFEGMAISGNGKHLYPMLEGVTAEDTAAGLGSDLRIYEVTIDRGGTAAFTGEFWRYRMEHPGNSLGDFIAVNDHQFLVIERDQGERTTARFKAVFLVDVKDRDHDGYVDKELLVNLMAVPDPKNLANLGAFFTFPFQTIEDVELIDSHTIAVMNDNNFPGTGGRSTTQPDQNEYIEIGLDQPLKIDHRLLPRE
jgi:hypothetical protein